MTFEDFMIDWVLDKFSYGLFFLALIAVVFGIVMSVISNPSGIVRSIIAVAVLGIVFGVGYSMADSTVHAFYHEFGVKDEGTSQMIGGGLITVYLLSAIAIVGIVITEVSKFFK